MNCYVCGQRGHATGRWYSRLKRIPWACFKCHNQACRFEYVNIDGQTAKAQPTWMLPTKELP